MKKLRVIVANSELELEEAVNAFLETHQLVLSTFQRNLFYDREKGWTDNLIETWTAFVLYEETK